MDKDYNWLFFEKALNDLDYVFKYNIRLCIICMGLGTVPGKRGNTLVCSSCNGLLYIEYNKNNLDKK